MTSKIEPIVGLMYYANTNLKIKVVIATIRLVGKSVLFSSKTKHFSCAKVILKTKTKKALTYLKKTITDG